MLTTNSGKRQELTEHQGLSRDGKDKGSTSADKGGRSTEGGQSGRTEKARKVFDVKRISSKEDLSARITSVEAALVKTVNEGERRRLVNGEILFNFKQSERRMCEPLRLEKIKFLLR